MYTKYIDCTKVQNINCVQEDDVTNGYQLMERLELLFTIIFV